MFHYLEAFVALFLFRYVRLVVNLISFWTFKPIPIPEEPTYTTDDVTVIIPSIDGDTEELREGIRSVLKARPFEIILVTIEPSIKRALRLAEDLDPKRIRVLSVQQANKRRQMCRAIPEVRTPITVFADDDILWPERVLEWMLAPFEDERMGGVGTCQRLRRAANPNIWNFLGAIYLERRNFDIAACTHMDGGLPCLSGRTVAYRTRILQDPLFTEGFTNETWGTYQLNADDDNFITRWMVNNGWKTFVQYHKECEVRTSLEDNPKFLKQCMRWSRSNWRSNLTSMLIERRIWTQQPWSTYAVHQTTVTQWALPIDILLVYFLLKATSTWSADHQKFALGALVFWMFTSKWIKLTGHFIRYPVDVFWLPVSILFGYFHCVFIKFYAMLTLHETAWGSRPGADSDDAYRMIRLPPYTYSELP